MSEGQDDNWEMPKPVFRSSTGSLPKSFEETLSQSFSPDKEDMPDEDDDILGVMEPAAHASSEQIVDDHAEPADLREAAKAETQAAIEGEPKRATFWSFTTIFLLIIVIVGAIAFGLFYFLRASASGDAY
jgi:hypothetical protein